MPPDIWDARTERFVPPTGHPRVNVHVGRVAVDWSFTGDFTSGFVAAPTMADRQQAHLDAIHRAMMEQLLGKKR